MKPPLYLAEGYVMGLGITGLGTQWPASSGRGDADGTGGLSPAVRPLPRLASRYDRYSYLLVPYVLVARGLVPAYFHDDLVVTLSDGVNTGRRTVLGHRSFIGGRMVRTASCVLAAAAVTALGLAPSVASAATRGTPVLAKSSTSPSAGDPDTTVTFTITSGALSMTAPTTADLGSGAPGATISGALGAVTVTDDRALLSAAWTTDASSTDWTTGTRTTNETIPATDVGYDPGSITTTGTITATGTPITLGSGPAAVVTGSAGVGDNTAAWDPGISVAVPPSAVGGVYSGTLTQSVS